MTIQEQKQIDNYIKNSQIAWKGCFNVQSYAMSILSDAQHSTNQKDKLINKAKYVLAKHCFGMGK